VLLNLFVDVEPFGPQKYLAEPHCLIISFKSHNSFIFSNSAEPLKDGHGTPVENHWSIYIILSLPNLNHKFVTDFKLRGKTFDLIMFGYLNQKFITDFKFIDEAFDLFYTLG